MAKKGAMSITKHKFEEIRNLFNYKSKGELPRKSHFTQDALQHVWHSQIEQEPADDVNRILLVSGDDNTPFWIHHDLVCALSPTIDKFHREVPSMQRAEGLRCDGFDGETMRALLKYTYLRCVDPEIFAAKINEIVKLAAFLDIEVVKKACGIEIKRQMRTKEMTIDELAIMAANSVLHADLPEARQIVVRKLAVRWPEVCTQKEKTAWRRLKQIARAQEDRSDEPDNVMTVLDEIMETLPKAATFMQAKNRNFMEKLAEQAAKQMAHKNQNKAEEAAPGEENGEVASPAENGEVVDPTPEQNGTQENNNGEKLAD